MTDQPHDDTLADLVKEANREGLPQRADARRPVPRFEVVHKPRLRTVERKRVTDATSGLSRWVEVVDPPNPQPWHTRVIGGNGEPLMSTETYVDEESAYDALLALAVMFGLEEPRIMPNNHGGEDEPESLEGELILGGMQRTMSIPIMRVEVEA